MKNYTTKNFTKGINTKEILVLHHTGTSHGTTQGNINACISGNVSFHYLVNELGEVYSFNDENSILWHAGTSQWNGKKDLNKYSIGIEVIGPGFSDIQRKAVEELMIDIIKRNNIKKENVVRHKDITSRKTDIDDSFWNTRFSSWEVYKNYLFSKLIIMGVYESQFKNKNYKAEDLIIKDVDGAVKNCIDEKGNLNAKEFTYLMLIGLQRLNERIKK